MLPSSSFAALLLVALIPGYAYLRLSEDARRPRANSALEEFLEVFAVGLGTTGLATLGVILLWPDEVVGTLEKASLDSPDSLRRAVVLTALVVLLALGLACIGAWATQIPGKGSSYSPNVWRSTLGLRRKDHLPYVVLELKDDSRRVQGVLHSYTTLDGDHPRDIALLEPKLSRDGTTWEADADYVVVSADEIAKIWLRLAHDPGQPRRRRF